MVYALASGLVGFESDSVRVFVRERKEEFVNVVVAEGSDSGCQLTLRHDQITPEDEDAFERQHIAHDYPNNRWSRELAREVCKAFTALCVKNRYADDVLDAGTRIIELDPIHAEGLSVWRILDLAERNLQLGIR